MNTNPEPALEPTMAHCELASRLILCRDMNEQARLIAASERAAGEIAASKRVFISMDHPEANGRKPVSGDAEYPLRIPLDDGTNLTLRLGQSGFNEVTNLLMDMLSNAPSHDDGSLLPNSPMDHLRQEAASLRAELAALSAKLAEATDRADRATEDIATAVKNWTDTGLRLSDEQMNVRGLREVLEEARVCVGYVRDRTDDRYAVEVIPVVERLNGLIAAVLAETAS